MEAFGKKLKKFKLKSTTPLLVTLLLISSFFLGSLYTKNQYLEKQLKAVREEVAGAQTAGVKPTGAPAKVNVAIGHLPVLGKNNAKVTVIEFADFRCPYCERFYKTVEPQLLKNYVETGKIKFAFRQYAFLGPASDVAANAAECANEQGKFWDYHNYLYDHQPNESDTTMFTTDKLTQIALDLGLNGEQFRTCLSANKYSLKVSEDLSAGQAAGVGGTPTTFVNGKIIQGAVPYSTFKAAIDLALQGK